MSAGPRPRVASPPTSSTGLGALMVAGVCWGTAGTLGTLLHRGSGLPLLSVAGYRIAVGGLILGVVIVLTRQFRLPRTRPGWLRVLGLAGFSALYQIGFFTATGQIGVALTTLIAVGSAPLIVLVVDAATGQHRVDGRLVATLVLAAVGLVSLVGTPPDGVGGDALVRGLVLALLAAIGFAGVSLIGARPGSDFHQPTGIALAFGIGGALVLVTAATRGPVTFEPTPATLTLVLALGLVPTAVGYLAYFRGLRTQSSTTGVLVALLEPITAPVLALAVLGERLTLPAVIGAVLLLGAVGLATTGAHGRAGPPGALR